MDLVLWRRFFNGPRADRTIASAFLLISLAALRAHRRPLMSASESRAPLSFTYQLPEDAPAFGDARIDFARMSLIRRGREIQLTATEFKLLAFLLQNPERVITRAELLETVWGHPPADPKTRTVDIHISKLRQKLEVNPAHPVHLRTVHWAGYKFIP
jgi:DNA-binding response OmpR family regulator